MVFACKYRHNIFLHTHVKTLYKTILRNTARFHAITVKEIGFANDHVHLIVDPGPNRTPAQTAKLLKGASARALLREFPWLRTHYFRSGHLWARGYFSRAIDPGREHAVTRYVKNQHS